MVEWISLGVVVIGSLICGAIYVGGYRQMVDNQRLATARAFKTIKRLRSRVRTIEAALYSEKILRQPTNIGDEDEDEDDE